VLFFAWLVQAVDTPELLGGFAAGLALSQRFFNTAVSDEMVLRALCS
jgi:Kef-type K+ transport system membrane component KefB